MVSRSSCSHSTYLANLFSRALDKKPGELRVDVDLNAEEGRTGNSASNKKRVTIRATKQVDFAVLRAWLNRQTSFDNGVLEAISECMTNTSCLLQD